MKNLCVLFFSTVFLFGCGDSEENMMSGKFASIDSCLSSIKKNTQSTLDIVRNEPGQKGCMLKVGIASRSKNITIRSTRALRLLRC